LDNVTHTLAGALLAQAVALTWPVPRGGLDPERRRRVLGWILVLGSNLPDLDFVYTGVTGGKIGYLLHHRGHTHTVLGALAAAAVLAAGAGLWMRRRCVSIAPSERRLLLAMCALGPLLHIAMDFTNDYGVHPFWPVHDGWYYGDSVFIAEPFFWASAAGLPFLAKTRFWRALSAITLGVGLVLVWGIDFVLLPSAVAVTSVAALMVLAGWRAPPRRAALAGVACWLFATLMFAVSGNRARAAVDRVARERFAFATTLDRVLTPVPANPVCWSVLLVQAEETSYRVRRGTLSLLPRWIDAAACPSAPGTPTAPLVPASSPATPALLWRGDLVLPIAELRGLEAAHCQFSAFLRFARVPWMLREGQHWIVGDLRYDREPGLGFAELELDAAPAACPRFVPPWTSPRSDLLRR
jgi:inner membrane protein